MLNDLQEVIFRLHTLLMDEDVWNDVLIDYHPPVVERVWRPFGDLRIYLHRIHPCGPGEALMHPHPWPSAVLIGNGEYEMLVGYGKGESVPPVAAKIVLAEGSFYEMTNPDGWHAVRPIGRPSMSLMVTGKPWDRPSPKSPHKLPRLDPGRRREIIGFFRAWASRQ